MGNAGMKITKISLCPHKQELTTTGWAQFTWMDERLKWDLADFKNVDRIRVDPTNTHCDVNYNNWPWGEQNCTYIAGSWTYDMENLDIKPSLGSNPQSLRDSPLDFTHLLDESGYEIIASQYVRTEKTYACCPNEVYPHVKSSFQFKMKQMFEGDTLMTP